MRGSRERLPYEPAPHRGLWTPPSNYEGGVELTFTARTGERSSTGDPPAPVSCMHGSSREGIRMTMTQRTGRFSRRAVLEGMGVGALGLAGAALLG